MKSSKNNILRGVKKFLKLVRKRVRLGKNKVVFKQRPFSYLNMIKWILVFQVVTSILDAKIPGIFQYLFDYLKCFFENLWEGDGAEQPPILSSDSDSSNIEPPSDIQPLVIIILATLCVCLFFLKPPSN